MLPIAYLAGPLGFSEVGRLFHQTVIIPLVKEVGFEIRDPWELTPIALIAPVIEMPYGQDKKKAWSRLNLVIGRNNVLAIEESDLIIAILDGTDVDSGTAGEIGYASALGKTVIGYRGDFRLSADNEGSLVNLQIEYFINSSGGQIVTNIKSLKNALEEYKKHFIKQ
jgi:nucleoside 2-deoxyribosyltransferase